MISLYKGFVEIKELYDSFKELLNFLQDYYTQITATIKALEDVIGWKTHIRDRPKDMPIMDKLRAKKTEVAIET